MYVSFTAGVMEALTELLKEKKMDEITAEETAARLGLTARDLYYHCRDIPFFFTLCFNARARQFAAACGSCIDCLLDATAECMRLFRKDREVFLALFASKYGSGAREDLYRLVSETVDEVCRLYGRKENIPPADLAYIRMFIAGELYGLLIGDISSGFKADPDELTARYRKFTGGFAGMIRGMMRRN